MGESFGPTLERSAGLKMDDSIDSRNGLVVSNGFLRPTDAALTFLRAHDRRLGAVIDAVGVIERAVNPDPFAGVVRHIVGQQISGKAQASIWSRLMAGASEVSNGVPSALLLPESLLALGENGLRSVGMSSVKAARILEIARRTAAGEIDFHGLAQKSDQDVIASLIELPGVGVWTAEMLLTFSFGRPNVLSFGDLGIRSGIMRLYGHKELPRVRFERYRKRYSPFGTAASFYLWKVGNGEVDPSVWDVATKRTVASSVL